MKDARRVAAARHARHEEWLHLEASHSAARDKGALYYFTGKPCAASHVARRLIDKRCEVCAGAPRARVVRTFARAARATIETGRLHYVTRKLVVVATTKAVRAESYEVEKWFTLAGERSFDDTWMVPVFDQYGEGRIAELRR